MKTTPLPRTYESPLRVEQKQQTQQRILQAVGQLIVEHGATELSLPLVAKRAGVALRTVFRHFETKDALLDEYWRWFLANGLKLSDDPIKPNEFPALIETLFMGFERSAPVIEAMLQSPSGREVRLRSLPRRRRMIKKTFEPVVAELPPADAHRVLAVVHLLFSAAAWQQMRDAWGLDGAESGKASAWALRVLLAELRRNPHSLRDK